MSQIILSVIYPIKDPRADRLSLMAMKSYQQLNSVEHIVVSSKELPADISTLATTIIISDSQSRGHKLNLGIQVARGNMVLLHHPRSVLPVEGLLHLKKYSEQLSWGAFTHSFDKHSWGLKFTSWYSNCMRGDSRGIYYLDHCLFAQKKLLEQVGLLNEIDIFEDTELCLKLRKQRRPTRLPFLSKTSAIRFAKNGFWRQSLLNMYLKWKYLTGASDVAMNKLYEKDLELNSNYGE